MNTNMRRATIVALSVVGVALAGIPWMLNWQSLPEPIATHWSLAGAPNGHTARWVMVLLVAVMTVPFAAVTVRLAVRSEQMPKHHLVASATWSAVLVGVGAGMSSSIVYLNHDAESWNDATGPWWILLWTLGLGAMFGVVARQLFDGLPVSVSDSSAPAVQGQQSLKPSQRAVWYGTARSGISAAIAGVSLALAVPAFVVGTAPFGWLFIVVGMVSLSMCRILVTVDRSGMTVAYGPQHWPRTRVPVEEIEGVRLGDVGFGDHGGFGYRGSLRLFGHAAIVIRRGPALHLDLRRGRRLVVSVDDPEPGARLLAAELTSIRPPASAANADATPT